jgi:hypothetical protein
MKLICGYRKKTLQEKLEIATLHLRPLPCNCLKMHICNSCCDCLENCRRFSLLVATVWSNCRRFSLLNELKCYALYPKFHSTFYYFPPKPQTSHTHPPHSILTRSFSWFTNSLSNSILTRSSSSLCLHLTYTLLIQILLTPKP